MTIQLLFILLALFLVLLNGFFVAAEFGLVKLRQTRVQAIKQQFGLRGRILARIHQQLDAYLSACQLGITLASLGLGWVGEPAFARLLEPVFVAIGIVSKETIMIIAFSVAFSFISFLHIVLGELMPKSLAIRQSEKISLWTAIPLSIFYWLFYPAILLLNTCSNFLLNLFGLMNTHQSEYYYSTDEIKLILNASHTHGELTGEETDIISHTLHFADLTAADVMRSIEELTAINLSKPIDYILNSMAKQRYSRYPVFRNMPPAFFGIIHLKDLFAAQLDAQKITSLDAFIRPLLKIPRELSTLDLLRQFRDGESHFGIVYNEHQSPIGFITLDDLLRVMLGRIKDEFHQTPEFWVKNPDGSLTVKGNCPIAVLESALGIPIPVPKDEDEDIDTLNGLILAHLGRLPNKNERVVFSDFDVVINQRRGVRIAKMTVYLKLSKKKRKN